MFRLKATLCLSVVIAGSAVLLSSAQALGQSDNAQKVGKAIFNDKTLSIQKNQACSSCHGARVGFTGPDSMTNSHGAVFQGSIAGRFGNRKPPSAAYATLSPILSMDDDGLWSGGNFWDGRATGEKLGNPAADQAQGPFLNPAEMALPDSACVVHRVCTGTYARLFKRTVGANSCAISWPADIDTTCQTEGAQVALSSADRNTSDHSYDEIAVAIAAYENSLEVNQFTSKFDAYLQGKATLTIKELAGLSLFDGKAHCANCHISTGANPLFTDFTYDNIGTPKNVENPVYAQDPNFIDLGLGAFLQKTGLPPEIYEPNMGREKVPTLRNLNKRPNALFVKDYAHNGYFKSLEEIVHFYNTRDVLPTCASGSPGERVTCWPAPEYPQTVNHEELGNLRLSPKEEAAIVAFLKTLSDGFHAH